MFSIQSYEFLLSLGQRGGGFFNTEKNRIVGLNFGFLLPRQDNHTEDCVETRPTATTVPIYNNLDLIDTLLFVC